MSFSLRFRKITSSLVATGLMLAIVGCGPDASTPKPAGNSTTPMGSATPPGMKPGPVKPKEQTSSTTDDEKKGDEVPEPAAKSDG